MQFASLSTAFAVLPVLLCALVSKLDAQQVLSPAGQASSQQSRDAAGYERPNQASGTRASGPGASANHSAAEGGFADGGLPGGAAMADFGTLMNLIQQTVDPDSWIANGGTNTLMPYPSGVYVDPRGRLQRLQPSANVSDVANLLSSDELDLTHANNRQRHPWQRSAAARTISLKNLDQALAQILQRGLAPSREMLALGGLNQIRFVKIDIDNEDILLSGPADPRGHGIALVDVANIAALIRRDTQPLGCTIEPDETRLAAASQFAGSSAATAQLARSPQRFVRQLQEILGDQQAKFFGINSASTTALALLSADEHMKRVGFGQAALRTSVRSYFDFLDDQRSVPAQSLVRWWFAYRDDPILVGPQNTLFQLPDQVVQVMSEQQWVTQQGRQPTGQTDPAAEAFAQHFTSKLPELRREEACYARLCSVFELSLAFQLVLEASGQPNLQAWFPNLCRLAQTDASLSASQLGSSNELSAAEQTKDETDAASALESRMVSGPKIEGLAAWHRTTSGTTVAVVSGGVKIAPQGMASRTNWRGASFLAKSNVPEPPQVPPVVHGNWWWD